jgi:NADPH:quinone reductase-like Zn-dependent oxidoreductase
MDAVKAGRDVTRFKAGDLAAVGCMVDSGRICSSCMRGLEQYCVHFPTFIYNGADKHLGGQTFGGYSESIVVDEAFTLKLSSDVNLAATAPLLSAGITTYSPLGFGDAADAGAGEPAPSQKQVEDGHGQRVFGSAHQGQGSIQSRDRASAPQLYRLSDAMSITKRYFTSPFKRRSYAWLI